MQCSEACAVPGRWQLSPSRAGTGRWDYRHGGHRLEDRRLRLGSSLGDGSGLGARKCPEVGRNLVRSWRL